MSKSFSSATEFKLERSFQIRLYFFSIIIILTFVAFVSQLVNLQIFKGQENSNKAERFVRKSEYLPAARGLIFDRNFYSQEVSKPLVYNSASLDVIVNSAFFKNDPKAVKEFVVYFYKVLAIPKDFYTDLIKEPGFTKRVSSKKNIILLRDISKEQQERIAVFDKLAEKVVLVPSPKRIYQMGPGLAHVTGYVGKPSKRDLENREIKPYQLVGKTGIELKYDALLRGSDGYRIQKRNSSGAIEDEKVVEDARMGNNLILTIDKKLQIAAYNALKGFRGTVIVMKPGSGEILAMASNPSYDPNIMSGKSKTQKTEHYQKITKSRGFLNLAIQSKFPPASTFKTLIALTALESENRINFNPYMTFNCNGTFTLRSSFVGVPDQEFKCWEKRGHGNVNLIRAIEKSCSVYFYNLGYRLGAEPILAYSRYFGLDKKSNVDLPGEIDGFVPSNEWKKRAYGTKWFDGDTINLSIGQGFIATTPISMALFYMSLLNNGKIYQPFLLWEVRDPITNSVIHKTTPKVLRDIPIKSSSLETLYTGLKAVGKTGTAAGVMNIADLPEVAGKTGTAQTRRRGLSKSNHAWFVGYAPHSAPIESQILIAVFVEYGVGGSVGAAPIAREILKVAFPPGSFKRKDKVEHIIVEEEKPIIINNSNSNSNDFQDDDEPEDNEEQ